MNSRGTSSMLSIEWALKVKLSETVVGWSMCCWAIGAVGWSMSCCASVRTKPVAEITFSLAYILNVENEKTAANHKLKLSETLFEWLLREQRSLPSSLFSLRVLVQRNPALENVHLFTRNYDTKLADENRKCWAAFIWSYSYLRLAARFTELASKLQRLHVFHKLYSEY